MFAFSLLIVIALELLEVAHDALSVLAIAALIIMLARAFFLVRRARQRLASPSPTDQRVPSASGLAATRPHA